MMNIATDPEPLIVTSSENWKESTRLPDLQKPSLSLKQTNKQKEHTHTKTPARTKQKKPLLTNLMVFSMLLPN